jgi:hypothetical protein
VVKVILTPGLVFERSKELVQYTGLVLKRLMKFFKKIKGNCGAGVMPRLVIGREKCVIPAFAERSAGMSSVEKLRAFPYLRHSLKRIFNLDIQIVIFYIPLNNALGRSGFNL